MTIRQPTTGAVKSHGSVAGAAKDSSILPSIPGRSWFDAYSLQAQWAPVLFAVAPIAIAAPALVGTKGLAGSAAMLVCLPPVLAHKARDFGKRLESGLWASWGGPPTTRLMRHRDRTVSETTKTRYFAVLARTANIERPTPEEEAADSSAADAVYESAGDWLRPMTRAYAGTSLVATKIASYGFARNLLGIRWLGLALAIATSVCMAAVTYFRRSSPDADFNGAAIATLAAIGCASIWAFGVNGASVRSAADAYARALLECCDAMPSFPATKVAAAERKQKDSKATNASPTGRTASKTEAGKQK